MEYYSAFKREGNSDTCYNMDEPEDIVLSEVSQSQDTHQESKSKETRSRMVLARGWE